MMKQKERKRTLKGNTLFDLTGDYLKLLEFAMEAGEEEAQALADTMAAIEGEFEDKADNYAKVINALYATADSLDAEIKRLQSRKTAMNNNADRIKKNLEKAMVATGKEKFKTTLYSFGIQNNPAAVVIDDESAIPKEYRIPQPDKVDKTAIKEFLKAGNTAQYAHLEQSRSLRIR